MPRRRRRSLAVFRRCSLLLLPVLLLLYVLPLHTTTNDEATPVKGRIEVVGLPPYYSLRQAVTAGVLERLVLYCGYHGKLGMWNAFPHIKRLLTEGGYDFVYRAYVSGGWPGAAVMVQPNFWRPGAEDWREWRLAPYQRINRLWGMRCISLKETLMRTLDAHYGVAKCPFAPPTFVLDELKTSAHFGALISSRRDWLLKKSLHRGQGVRVVSSAALLAIHGSTSRFGLTAPPSDQVEELRRWLRVKASGGTLLQQPIERPLLVGGRKSSLRLYSLITCADPLRVYLHAEGFALFASHAYNSTDPAADPYGFLTNAAVNRGEPAAIFNAGVSASSASAAKEAEEARAAGRIGWLWDDHGLASSLGLRLSDKRWSLDSFLTFVERRQQRRRGRPHTNAPPVNAAALRRELERLVLRTYVAARPKLAAAANASLAALGLAGAHEYAATFELAAFDVMLDEEGRPWLLEVNTSPSLKEEAQGDLPVKLRVIEDMLRLADAAPEPAAPPEVIFGALMRANALNVGGAAASRCRRRWRLGGCRHCPTWAEAGHLWRAASERRRAGGFVPLSPSADSELRRLAAVPVWARPGGHHDAISGRPTAHDLLVAWTELALMAADSGAHDACLDAECIRKRWDQMLCKEGERLA